MCLKLILQVTPLNMGELKVLEGTHRTEPMGLLGREVGLVKHTWNSAPMVVKNCTSLNGAKKEIKKFLKTLPFQ